MKANRKSLPAFKQMYDRNAMLAEAVQHWLETNEIRQRDYIVGVFISNDTDIERRSYDGDYESTDQGLNMAILYDHTQIEKLPRKEKWAIYREIGERPGLHYMEQSALEKYLIELFGFEHLNILPQTWKSFIKSEFANDYEHAMFQFNYAEGRLIRLKEDHA